MLDADTYLGALRDAYRAGDAWQLGTLLDPLDAPTRDSLCQNLQSAPNLRPSSYSSLAKSFFPDNPAFADFVAAYLLFVRDSHFTNEADGDESYTFELFSASYRAANTVLAGQEAVWFVPALRHLSNALATLALQADAAAEDPKGTQAGVAAMLLTRSLSIAATERSTEWPSKRNAVIYLANQSFRIYFSLNNLRMCDTVVKNTRDARDYLEMQYPKADQVTFAYYMGRMYLYQRRMRKAMLELRKAFDMCTNQNWKNKRLILVYLVAASLPLGIFPREELLAEFDLQEPFAPLIHAAKVGDYQECLHWLGSYQDWHIQKGTFLILRDKLELVCWRNLLRRTFVISQALGPATSGPPLLRLADLLVTAQIAFNDASLDLDDIEAMCASLLDQGYLKAYIQQERGILVLQRGEQSGFPPMSTVRMLGDDA